MCATRKFFQRETNSDNVFYDDGKEDPNSTKRGPSFKWRFDDSPRLGSFAIFQGIWTSIALMSMKFVRAKTLKMPRCFSNFEMYD